MGSQIKTASPAGETYTLEEMQSLVGGYVEIVQLWGGSHYLLLNEEGRLKNLPVNKLASALLGFEVRGSVAVVSAEEVA